MDGDNGLLITGNALDILLVNSRKYNKSLRVIKFMMYKDKVSFNLTQRYIDKEL